MNNHFAESITNDDIRDLPLLGFEGEIIVVEDEKSFFEAIQMLKNESILGFDTETKPTFRKGEYNPTAMIQLSTMEQAILFRLNKVGYRKPLVDLMADANVLKLGISIDDDIKALRKLRNFNPSGFTDLNTLAKEMGVKHIGVKKLTAIFLEYRISKGQQTSNWENETLTKAQEKYAATDAWICLKIYHELNKGHN